LTDKADHFPSQLSGGEQQRVAIARALAKKPMLILADEPTGNLDETTGEKIMTLMKKLNRETGTCFVVVSHDQKMAKLADRLVRIHEGRIVQ
jgi:ABC-type lipoprotein export system ATPase subunit